MTDETGTPATSSLQGQLRASIAKAQSQRTEDFVIPGYEPTLWVTFRATDQYGEAREIVTRHANVPDEATKEIYVAADTLAAMCLDTFAIVDGKKQSLGVKLGCELAAYLGQEAETDRQGVLTVYGQGDPVRTMPLMTAFAAYEEWSQTAAVKSVQEAAGNSQAPSQ